MFALQMHDENINAFFPPKTLARDAVLELKKSSLTAL